MRFLSLSLLGVILLQFLPLAAQQQGASVAEQYLLAAANQERQARQLPQLHLDPSLTHAAKLHALAMAQYQRISHRFSGEEDLAERAAGSGARFSLITENVAEAPQPAEIHGLWMHSPGHRANLLDSHVDAVGIAVVQSSGEFYAVEDFARTVEHLTFSQQESAVSALLQRRGLVVLPNGDEARQTCQLSTGYAGPRKPWFIMRYTAAGLDQLPEELLTKLGSGRYHRAEVGACGSGRQTPFTSYSIAVLLYP